MSTSTDSNLGKPVDPEQVRQQIAGKHVCPFCGLVRNDAAQPCSRCMLEDTGATRSATRARIGPWFVMQSRNPSAPGMKFSTLIQLIRKGHVSPRAIIRGPSTQQLWAFAVQVRGVSREMGLCWHCGNTIDAHTTHCAGCGKSQDIQGDPDALSEIVEMRPRVVREIAGPDIAPLTSVPSTSASTPGDSNDAPDPTPPVIERVIERTSTGAIASAEPSAEGQQSEERSNRASGHDDGTPSETTDRVAALRAASEPTVESPDGLAEASASALARRPRSAMSMQRASSQRLRDDTILSASELAAAFQLNMPTLPTRRRRRIRSGLILMVFMGLAGAALLLARPDYRDASVGWLTVKWDQLSARWAAPVSKPTVVRDRPAEVVADDLPIPVAIPPAKAPARVVEAPPPPKEAPSPNPAPVGPAPVAAPAPVYSASDDLPTRVRKLRNAALDAEGRGDYRDAVRFYEQIRQYPRDIWPGDLQIRLDSARQRTR